MRILSPPSESASRPSHPKIFTPAPYNSSSHPSSQDASRWQSRRATDSLLARCRPEGHGTALPACPACARTTLRSVSSMHPPAGIMRCVCMQPRVNREQAQWPGLFPSDVQFGRRARVADGFALALFAHSAQSPGAAAKLVREKFRGRTGGRARCIFHSISRVRAPRGFSRARARLCRVNKGDFMSFVARGSHRDAAPRI